MLLQPSLKCCVVRSSKGTPSVLIITEYKTSSIVNVMTKTTCLKRVQFISFIIVIAIFVLKFSSFSTSEVQAIKEVDSLIIASSFNALNCQIIIRVHYH